MSDYQELRETLTRTPMMLVDADSGDARLLSRERASQRVMGAVESSDVAILMDLSRALENFSSLTGRDDRDFTVTDIEKITGLPYATVDSWVQKQIIVPSVQEGHGGGGRGSARRFSWGDAFAFGAMASLRRQGVSLGLLRKVARLLVSIRGEVKVASADAVEAVV